jgi:uncharacterized protein YdaU (DUF1376 family)
LDCTGLLSGIFHGVIMNKPDHIMFTISAWLTDFDFLDMTCEEKGLYFFLVLNIYDNGGKYKLCPEKICKFANISKENYEKAFKNISSKFKIKRGFIQHDKCSAVLERTQVIREKRVKAGKARWEGESKSTAGAEQVHKQKGASALQSKVKLRKEKKREENISLQAKAMMFADDLDRLLGPFNSDEAVTFKNISIYLLSLNDPDIFTKAATVLRDVLLWGSNHNKNKNDMKANFNSKVQKELGWKPKKLKGKA